MFVKQTVEFQRTTALLENVVRTTGEAAERSVPQLNAHADALRRITAAGGNEIRETQARLLAYTGVVGKEFDRATEAALNWATAYGTTGVQAAEAIGKALNFPTRGLAALTKQGFIFSQSQMEQIKHFEETNQLAKAQAIILAEIESVTDGAAAAYRNTLGGALKAVRESFGDLFEMESKGMQDLIENINIVADSLQMIPTYLSVAVTYFEDMVGLAKEVAGVIAFIATGGQRGAGLIGAGTAQRGNAAADLSALQALLNEQRSSVTAGIIARANARPAGGGGGRTPGEVFAVATEEELNAIAKVVEQHHKDAAAAFHTRMDREEAADAAVQAVMDQHHKDSLEAFAYRVDMESKGLKQLSEEARVFKEQTQIALGNFFASFFRTGNLSLRNFWEEFQNIGSQVIGNVMAKFVMERAEKAIGNLSGGQQVAAGIGLFAVGTLVDAFLGARDAAIQMRMAMAASARAIEDFASYANAATLTPLQQEMARLTRQRDDLARQAVGASGIRGFTGGLDEAIEAARLFFGATGNRAYKELLDQLLALSKAFELNTEAAERMAKEQERAARETQRARELASISAFRDSLLLSGQSTLSPVQQLEEARRQYEAIRSLALDGDSSAIASLPETARALLDASRAVNASGVRYAADFERVSTDLATLIGALEGDFGSESIDVIDTIIERTDDWVAIQEASLAVQQDGFTSVVDELVEVRETLNTRLSRLELLMQEAADA